MRSLSIFSVLFIISITVVCQTVRIDFMPGTSDDIDLIIQEGLESIGMASYINYYGRSDHKEFDFILKYDETDRTVRFNLYNKEKTIIRTLESPVHSRNFHRAVSSSLTDLFDQRVRLRRDRSKYPFRSAIISHLEKIDSATYIIRIHTGDYRFIDELEESFLTMAGQRTSNFKTWYRNTKNQSDYQYGLMVSSSLRHEIRGVVIGIDGEEPIRLNEPPDIYSNYMDEQNPTPGVEVSFRVENADSTGTVFIARDTGSVGSWVKYPVFLNGKWVCNIGNIRYIKHSLPAGEHTIAVQRSGHQLRNNSPRITINIEPGEIIHFKIVQSTELVLRAFLVELEEFEAREIFPALKINEHCM